MRYIADLHTHSTASDGQYSPEDLVRRAKERGLEILALTDHDTLAGVEAAARAGEALGLWVLRGIELGAAEYENLHILGYGISSEAPMLTELCGKFKAGRDERSFRILDYLREKGFALTLEEVEELAKGNIVGRPHFAQAMVRRGYVRSNREAFDLWLDTEDYHQKVKRFKVPAKNCLEAIHLAGGKASLAHPYQVGLEDEALEELVAQLKEDGLDAIECYYPKHTQEQTEFYLYLAEKYDLHITGGSDFHGERVKPDVQLAAWELELDWLLDT